LKILKLVAFSALTLGLLVSCSKPTSSPVQEPKSITSEAKYSLAQWSFNRDLFAGEMDTVDFIYAAGEMGFDGVEYVSQFFQDKVADFEYLDSLNVAAKAAGIKNIMIQVDNIGNLGASNPEQRAQAIAEAKKWVDAASYLACDMIRVNAHGDGSPEQIKAQSIEAIAILADYANSKGVQIIIENHGGISNDGSWLADLISKLADKKVAGLADFHNWCIERENGELWGAPCIKEYDNYKGFAELISTAQSVSVKALEFDSQGNETSMDFEKFFQIMQAASYAGYLGIEYEGSSLPSREGILKTKALAERTRQAIYQQQS
jgi:sugar phosphate isomerase/epimerase